MATDAKQLHESKAVLPNHIVSVGPDMQPNSEDVERIADGLAQVRITQTARSIMAASEAALSQMISEERCIYGVTTGYGPLAGTHVSPRCSDVLQHNLIYHLATGVGPALSWRKARAIVFARLQALSQGYSAVSDAVVDRLVACLNAGLAPVIPEKGTVGASGDLTPLSHLALALIGEGAWMDRHGPVSNDAAFSRMEFDRLPLGPKEGLALVNGTSAMTGIAALNGALASRLVKLGCILSLVNAEVFSGHRAAWHPLVGAARGQPGQQRVHDFLWALANQADRLQDFEPLPPKLMALEDVNQHQELPQDPYSIRCVPQLLGASLDMLEMHDDVVARELSAVTDNPLIFAEEGTLIHAGNFFGQHVAFASDALLNAVTMVAVLMERQIARITDVRQSEGLPAFLQGNQTGLHSGFMGAQVTASALVAEMRSKATPASIQSIPTNANNQDVVTMGTIAARKTSDVLEDVMRVVSIKALCVAQAMDLQRLDRFSKAAKALHGFVRSSSPFLHEDRPLSGEIEGLATQFSDPKILEIIYADLPSVKDHLAQF
ncbi:MAG: aromatic amino acid ammonia-lyase [Pseudomonadota bacterium]